MRYWSKAARISRFTLVTAAALTVIGACADSVTSPSRLTAPDSPSLVTGVAVAKTIEVCIDVNAPAGTYTIAVADDASVAGDIITNPVVLAPGQCGIAFFRPGADLSVAQVTLTASTDAGAGTFSFTCVDDLSAPFSGALCVSGTAGAGNVVSAQANGFHGSTVTFFYVLDPVVPPADGCTFTQGYWKNKGAAAAAAFDFDGGVNNGLTVLQTPPKGNVYYILAHQYIAAALNVQNGASMDGAALDAFNAATAYFAVASAANPLPAGYTKASVTALADILADYNEGIIGPGHCDDV